MKKEEITVPFPSVLTDKGKSLFCDIKLRKLIDSYSESGSLSLVYCIGIDDVLENDSLFDPFPAGIMATSGLEDDPYMDLVQMKFDEIVDILVEEYEASISEDFIAELARKYNAFLLPVSDGGKERLREIVFG